ncbi:MAG: VWA domain-containing protein [Planctomycetota bacterium]|nr:MAG: VWA domain-containing protein [Planctomycetota bacterium]
MWRRWFYMVAARLAGGPGGAADHTTAVSPPIEIGAEYDATPGSVAELSSSLVSGSSPPPSAGEGVRSSPPAPSAGPQYAPFAPEGRQTGGIVVRQPETGTSEGFSDGVSGGPLDWGLDFDVLDEEGEPYLRSVAAGTIVSVLVHAWLLLNLAGMEWFEPPAPEPAVIQTHFTNEESPEEPETIDVAYELANPKDRDLPVREVLNAASLGQVVEKKPEVRDRPLPITELVPERRNPMYDIAEGLDFHEELVVKGTVGEHLLQIESALDRVTWEIARNLQERKLLVVWLLDASDSLKEQRTAIVGRLERIYGELDALQQIGQIPKRDRPLLSGVVLFGQTTYFATPQPTDEFATIRKAIAEAPNDPSGVENVFGAVIQVTKLWSKYRVEHGRRMMLIIVTDEAGDDFGANLETAIARCRHYGAKAYVIGPPAVFGRRKGFVPYVAPENGKTYQLEVDLGPETPAFETLELPFWFDGPQLRYLSAGFPPYALARLVNETGGVYFMTNMTTTRGLERIGEFDPAVMAAFRPDYGFGSPEQYLADLQRHPIRRAVFQAALASRQLKLRGMPPMRLKVEPNSFKQQAADAQKIVAENQLVVDTILQAFPADLEKQLETEPSPRWRMSFCLSYGRLLAHHARNLEYNAALASVKNDLTPQDVATRANVWILHPDEQINYATNVRPAAKRARRLLERVVREAPGTPWAVLAARELQQPFGLKVEFQFEPPPPPPPPRKPGAAKPKLRILFAPENKPKKRQPPPRPTPPPKPPVLPRL